MILSRIKNFLGFCLLNFSLVLLGLDWASRGIFKEV